MWLHFKNEDAIGFANRLRMAKQIIDRFEDDIFTDAPEYAAKIADLREIARWLIKSNELLPLADKIDETFAEQNDPARKKLVEEARELYAMGSDDNVEVDDDAAFSDADSHTWVMMWGCVKTEKCALCEKKMTESDDNWDDLCPGCADRVSDHLDNESASDDQRDAAIEALRAKAEAERNPLADLSKTE